MLKSVVANSLVLLALVTTPALAHDEHTATTPEQKAVFHFYSRWMRPNDFGQGRRAGSCCDMKDCHAVETKREGGTWFFLDVVSHPGEPQWRVIPEDLLEQNQPDPEESPNSESHACFTEYHVFCATLGTGM